MDKQVRPNETQGWKHVNKRRRKETKTLLKHMKSEGDLNKGAKTQGESNKSNK